MNAPLRSTPTAPLRELLRASAAAVDAVLQGQSLTQALEGLPERERAGAQALSFSAMRSLGLAQALLLKLCTKPPKAPLRGLLLCAITLLLPREEARGHGDFTVVNEAVACAKKQQAATAAFVNAVLRRFLRERDALLAQVQGQAVARHNHPAWWIEALERDWPEHAQAMLEANQAMPPMVLRVNARRMSASAYRDRLAAAGFAAELCAPENAERLQPGAQALRLLSPCPVSQLPGFEAGEVSVQDIAAQRAAPLLLSGLKPGARVLDACSAPGGKTAHLLELMDLEVWALDADAKRLARVSETLERLGLAATLRHADAARTDDWWDGQPFDAVLLDAPCSAAGINRRHPDVRWLRRPSDLPALAATQGRLLRALWPLLKPGGRLLYATCSVFKIEGEQVVASFLSDQPQARIATEPQAPGHLLGVPRGDAADALAWGDGFFYALLERSV